MTARWTLLAPMATLAATLAACKPTTMMGTDDPAADLSPRAIDLAPGCPAAADPKNRLENADFESGPGSANNTGAPASTITRWDGCCNLDNQGRTTDWSVSGEAARCGLLGARISSTGSRGDVLNQPLSLADAAGKDFVFTAWVRITDVGAPGPAAGSLLLDVFDLQGKVVIAASARLTVRTEPAWQELSLSGSLPKDGGPLVQIQPRINTAGTLTGFIDDLRFVLK